MQIPRRAGGQRDGARRQKAGKEVQFECRWDAEGQARGDPAQEREQERTWCARDAQGVGGQRVLCTIPPRDRAVTGKPVDDQGYEAGGRPDEEGLLPPSGCGVSLHEQILHDAELSRHYVSTVVHFRAEADPTVLPL